MSKSEIIKGLFFDLDGTLFDTDKANFIAYRNAFADEGIVLESHDFDMHSQGRRADVFIPLIVPYIETATVQRIMTSKVKHYAAAMEHVKPNTVLIDFLRMSRGAHKIVLATTAKRANATRVLETAGLGEIFDFAIFGDEVNNPKPHPEVYLRALELTGLSPNEVIAFEDSQAGLEAARSAGISVMRIAIPQ